ncbi:hypothetical protein KSF_034410 [Reticulibacter mediterranei]|uniref:Nudix hydrolase domain-containing protein n=1 Tax=Reticulibacter mediterranei TaxID=2778369 RepID=A0A8J3IGY0_9CHLR|nr:NUDIX domain-containing protein [Reticulibacter mediterranei]GHO93393.1 hypothetical protein KSF_034410 [Reticulibacter mediterranei]
MSIFSHNIYENIRTRTIVLYQGKILLHPPGKDGSDEAWKLPGGGLEPHESLAECARREVLEETGIPVRVGRIAFLLEWIVPRYTGALEDGDGHGFGLEVYHYAYPEEPLPPTKAEFPGEQPARWILLEEVAALSVWPIELKDLCQHLSQGNEEIGSLSLIGKLSNPWDRTERNAWSSPPHEITIEDAAQ